MDGHMAPRFVLAGNGGYGNRGCEAIVRGTLAILEATFGDLRVDAVSIISSEEAFRRQQRQETDPRITHGRFRYPQRRLTAEWFGQRLVKAIAPGKLQGVVLRELEKILPKVSCVLSIGGDNYAVENDRLPWPYIGLDDFVRKRGKPLVIWGASVGPFDSKPEFESFMKDHLTGIDVFARESTTVDYLGSLGLGEWVHKMADPGFVMAAVDPGSDDEGLDFNELSDSLGLNFSPLVGQYVTGSSGKAWVLRCAAILDEVAKKTRCPILLVPHVAHPVWDDEGFMKEVLACSNAPSGQISLLPLKYSAGELKYIIGRLKAFVGMRMHATIAAISSEVPTINIAYSIKARGLSRDMNGHEDFCLAPNQLEPGKVAERVVELLDRRDEVAGVLQKRLPAVRQEAMNAGKILAGIIGAV